MNTIYIAGDITEVKALANQLRQSQKMEAIGTLADGIAHDFNNILTPVLGYAEILTDDLPADSPLGKSAQEILTAAFRARDLVTQTLNLSRQTKQERRPVQIHLIVKEALKLLRLSLPTTIEICQGIDPQCGSVLAAPTMLHQVVMNLCTGFSEIINAEKAKALGIRHMMMKPIMKDELAKILRQVLDQPEE